MEIILYMTNENQQDEGRKRRHMMWKLFTVIENPSVMFNIAVFEPAQVDNVNRPVY